MTRGTLLDANLLCLLTVGRVSTSSIRSHPRLKAFDDLDFSILGLVLERVGDPVLCPHVLAETSNLLGYRQAPAERSKWLRSLAQIVQIASERDCLAREAVSDPAYDRLGLTDAVLLMLSADQTLTLVSDDLQLCLAATIRGSRTVNYNYLRDGALRVDQL